MQQIRKSVFETNSSSTHSISIDSHGDIELITPDDDGYIYIDIGQFGWEEETHHDFATKASYLATQWWSRINSDTLKQALNNETISEDFYNFMMSEQATKENGYFNDYNLDFNQLGSPYSDHLRELNNLLSQLGGNEYTLFVDTIVSQTGAKDVIIRPTYSGYIDHQSFDVPADAYSDLRNYLFNRASYLETDNDNH